MIRHKTLLWIFRIVVGAVFIWAGALKISDPLGFAQNIANYRVFPREVSFLIAVILPWIELLCGALVILGLFRVTSALLLSILLAAFLGLIAVTLFRGIDVNCGCFGSLDRRVDYHLVVTDCVLLYLTINVFISSLKGSLKSTSP